MFRPFADDLAVRVALRSPRDVLELAAGTGVLTKQMVARLPAATFTATDLNPAMVHVGASNVPEADWRPVDATDLPFADSVFDVVACQFGVMFFPERPAAYAGIGRVLRPGGSFLFNSWGPLETHEVEAAVLDALADAFPDDPPRFLARVPHGYHDPEQVAADLAAAGFVDIAVEHVDLSCTGRTAAELAEGYCRGTPLRHEIRTRGDLETATRAVSSALETRFGPGIVSGRMAALVAEARTPVG